MNSLTIQEVHTYLKLVEDYRVPDLKCPVKPEDHFGMLPDLDDSGELFLYCLTCNTKVYPGLLMTERIRKHISNSMRAL